MFYFWYQTLGGGKVLGVYSLNFHPNKAFFDSFLKYRDVEVEFLFSCNLTVRLSNSIIRLFVYHIFNQDLKLVHFFLLFLFSLLAFCRSLLPHPTPCACNYSFWHFNFFRHLDDYVSSNNN